MIIRNLKYYINALRIYIRINYVLDGRIYEFKLTSSHSYYSFENLIFKIFGHKFNVMVQSIYLHNIQIFE